MKKSEKKFRVKLVGLIGIVLIFALAWIYFYYPLATVVITPRTAVVTQEITVLGSPEQKYIDWDNNILPLHKFEVTITDEDKIDVSGSKKTGDKRAGGKVRFINERKEKVEIPAGTVLLGENKMKYRTTEDITIPAMQIDYLMNVQVGRKAGQIEAEIVAEKKGAEGNISIGKINTFAQPLENVHVINPEPISGGSDIVKKIVTEKDIEKLKGNLTERIKTQLLNKIYQELGGNYRLIEKEINYSKIDYNLNNKAGDVIPVLKGSATLIAGGYLLKNNEIDRLATNIFQKNLEKGHSLLSKGIVIEDIKLAEKEDGLYNIIMKSAGQVIPHINVNLLKGKLAGNTLNKARDILAAEKMIENYIINTREGSDKLPLFGFAIKIITDEPQIRQVINLK